MEVQAAKGVALPLKRRRRRRRRRGKRRNVAMVMAKMKGMAANVKSKVSKALRPGTPTCPCLGTLR
jgi:hypothetical protein